MLDEIVKLGDRACVKLAEFGIISFLASFYEKIEY